MLSDKYILPTPHKPSDNTSELLVSKDTISRRIEDSFSRRDFLTLALATGISLLAPSSVIAAISSTGRYCDGRLRLRSAIHGEAYEFRFRDTYGNYDRRILAELNWFLRCRDGSWNPMDLRTIETLNYFSALTEIPIITINSGYRSPSYNAKLAKYTEGVAKNSLHQYGRALDFSVKGMTIREVCSYLLTARNAMGKGGVGYYPFSNFVHLDSGPTREWVRTKGKAKA